ncbi:hypothetical protein KAJ27_02540 [bacterium]|nr:hypothetical protein [bacterium]
MNSKLKRNLILMSGMIIFFFIITQALHHPSKLQHQLLWLVTVFTLVISFIARDFSYFFSGFICLYTFFLFNSAASLTEIVFVIVLNIIIHSLALGVFFSSLKNAGKYILDIFCNTFSSLKYYFIKRKLYKLSNCKIDSCKNISSKNLQALDQVFNEVQEINVMIQKMPAGSVKEFLNDIPESLENLLMGYCKSLVRLNNFRTATINNDSSKIISQINSVKTLVANGESSVKVLLKRLNKKLNEINEIEKNIVEEINFAETVKEEIGRIKIKVTTLKGIHVSESNVEKIERFSESDFLIESANFINKSV